MNVRRIVGFVLAAGVLAGCGGGGSASAPTFVPAAPASTASPAPVVTPTSAPTAPAIAAVIITGTSVTAVDAATPDPVSGSASVTLAADVAGNGAATVELPADLASDVPPDTTIESIISSSPFDGLPSLSELRAPLAASRGVLAETTRVTAVAHLAFTFNKDVTFRRAPGFTFVTAGTLPSAAVYEVALYDPLRASLGFQRAFEGPGTLSSITLKNGKPGTKITFPGTTSPITFVANQRYVVVAYARAATSAAPTPAPKNVPTTAPSKPAPVSVLPAAVEFAAPSAPAQSVTVVQLGATKPFSLSGSDQCAAIATVSGTSPTFTIAPKAAGTCKLVALGDRSASAVLRIVVRSAATPQPSASPTSSPSPKPTASASPKPAASPSASPKPTASPAPVAVGSGTVTIPIPGFGTTSPSVGLSGSSGGTLSITPSSNAPTGFTASASAVVYGSATIVNAGANAFTATSAAFSVQLPTAPPAGSNCALSAGIAGSSSFAAIRGSVSSSNVFSVSASGISLAPKAATTFVVSCSK